MRKPIPWLKKYWVVIILIVLIIALFFTIRYFIYSIRTSYSEGELRPTYHSYFYTHREDRDQNVPQDRPQPSVNDIQPWMTFDYLNVVFKLPQDYLKNIFGIDDPRYPKVRIDTYAKEAHIEQSLMLTTIKKYITTYTAH